MKIGIPFSSLHKRGILLAGFVFSLLSGAIYSAERATQVFKPEQIQFFEKNVRSILSTKCYACHGTKKQESGLRLDTRSAVIKGGDNGPVVQPGSIKQSLLIEAIRYAGDLQMPPEEKLSDQEIAILTRWIEIGLPWPAEKAPIGSAEFQAEVWKNHWAFQKIKSPSLPEVKNIAWPQTSIDRFVLAKLEAAELHPAPQADRRTLIRRATFDLTGLPPTPEQIEAFLADRSADAYQRLIERLLASPTFGERWGRHWLDVARYADNKGYVFLEEKKFHWAYTYRDYVVEALNADLPYDRFLLEQLAADQLELGSDRRALRAMGFLTLGGRFSNNLHDIIDDRIDVISRGLMGLTVTCARCHDHKFDPVPQRDYYSLYGVLRSSREPKMPPLYETPQQTEQYKSFSAELEKRQKKLDDFLQRKFDDLLVAARTRLDEYFMAAHALRNKPSTQQFMLLVDKGDLNPTLIRRWRATFDRSKRQTNPVWAPWNVLANLPKREFAQASYKKLRQLQQQKNSNETINQWVLQALLAPGLQSMRQVAQRYEDLLLKIDANWKTLREQDAKADKLPDPQQEQIRQAFYGNGSPLNISSTVGRETLAFLPDRDAQNTYKKLLKEVASWSKTGTGAPPRAMVLLENKTMYNPRVFLRGNPARRGDQVPRQFLQAFSQDRKPFSHGSGRLEMARAIADPANPLTARVMVNRVWLHHFGTGLVSTPSDFGTQGDPPTHPQLLDHLASNFISNGWSLKHLHRQIMLSAVYRQSSNDRAEGQTIDPTNRLLWKMNRRRLEFESVRDAMLAVSDSLETTIGGPPVDVLESFSPRRTIYGFVDRMDVPGLLTTFDFPNPEATSPQRDTTTVTPQALFFMNGKLAAEVARRMLARRDLDSLKQPELWVNSVYLILFGRSPNAAEIKISQHYLATGNLAKRREQYLHGLIMTNEFIFID